VIHRAARWSFLVVLAVGAGGCTSAGSAGGGTTGHSDPRLARLVAAARLAPCPASSQATAPGGLPNVTLSCLGNGPAVHLAGLIGEPTVVNVWASWCGPCQEEAAALSTVYDEDRGKVRFLGVDTEDAADSALDFGRHVRPPVRYPSVVDPDRKVLLGLAAAPGPPETAFVDAAGRVVHVHPGPYRSAAELRADIAAYLQVR
jgi:thiol-disulfide isomerase/thioredoxin